MCRLLLFLFFLKNHGEEHKTSECTRVIVSVTCGRTANREYFGYQKVHIQGGAESRGGAYLIFLKSWPEIL